MACQSKFFLIITFSSDLNTSNNQLLPINSIRFQHQHPNLEYHLNYAKQGGVIEHLAMSCFAEFELIEMIINKF